MNVSLVIGLCGIAVIIAVMVSTGSLSVLIDLFYSSGKGSEIFTNLIFIGIIIGAIVVVLTVKAKKDD